MLINVLEAPKSLSNAHFRNITKIAVQVPALNFALLALLLSFSLNYELVGSTQVPFLMCTLEIPQKLQHKFLLLTVCYLLYF